MTQPNRDAIDKLVEELMQRPTAHLEVAGVNIWKDQDRAERLAKSYYYDSQYLRNTFLVNPIKYGILHCRIYTSSGTL